MPTLEEFNQYVQKLSAHDWYFDYSDDHRVWSRGNEKSKELQSKAKSDPVYKGAYEAYVAFNNSTELKTREAERETKLNKIRETLT